MEIRSTNQTKGFALVVSLSMMILLVIVAVGLLSLSTVTLRTSSQTIAQAEAQANARLALMQAIGEIQRSTGPDTRITAPADVVVAGAPPLTGVWKSWEGTNHDITNGRPVRPDYENAKWKTNDVGDRFITWLVSGMNAATDITEPATLVATSASTNTIPLLSEGTLGNSPGQVHVTPQPVNGNQGAYTWWVSPENQKARLIQPYLPRSNDASGWSDMAKTHATPDPEPFGLDSLVADPENFLPNPNNPKSAGKAISLATTELIEESNPANPHQSFHDLSTSSIGLLTNTATGGWRKDLSILTEKWDDIYNRFPDGSLPLFRYAPTPGATSLVPKPTEANYEPAGSGFYPWSEYSQYGANKFPMTYNIAAASWQSLVSFATKYKQISYNAGTGMPSAPIGWNSRVSFRFHPGFTFTNQDFYGHYHQENLNPILARAQLIIQAQAFPDPDPNNTENSEDRHRVNLRIVPIFIFWNPYNVEITKSSTDPEFGISALRSVPLAMSIINGTEPPASGINGNFRLLTRGDGDGVDGTPTGIADPNIPGNYGTPYYGAGDTMTMTGWLPYEFTLKPGEAKIFTPQLNSNTDGNNAVYYGTHILKEGYAAGDDFGIPLGNPDNIEESMLPAQVNRILNRFIRVPGRPGNELLATDQLRFKIRADRLTKMFTDAITTQSGAGAYFAIGTTRQNNGRGRDAWERGIGNNVHPNHIRSVQALNVDREWAQKYWPDDELVELNYQVSELIPGGGNPNWTNLYTVSFGPRITFGAAVGSPQNRPTKGLLQSSPFVNNAFSVPDKNASYHPANSAYDISYHAMSINDNLSPEVGMNGYIATGFQAGDGLSRFIVSEIPLKPMASLVELQSWNLRGNNPFPPFQYNLIGNSDATPLIQQDGILPQSPLFSNVATNLQHDDAYCANHLLFDDWFLSSIAPQPDTFGSSISRDIETVYREFLTGDAPLTNRAYQAIPEDRNLTSDRANERVAEMVNSPDGDGFLKIASRFEVVGMFNVNSTSVKAWRSLLGHARQQQVAHYDQNGITLDPNPYDHVVSRYTVASDIKAGEDAGIGALFPSGSEYAGFRTLNNDQLDELAEKIVEQVRLRGPFLSLSEFINRQLSTDSDLAISGALQAALDHLTDDPMAELKNLSNQLASQTMDPSDEKLDDVGYAFEQVAEGMSVHGFPGWIRQADILRPIAPVLSARDNTFTIRAYGDARDSTGRVTARAWCEATVRRTRNFVDDQSDTADSVDPPTSEPNQRFGRKYEVISFRWLSPDEV